MSAPTNAPAIAHHEAVVNGVRLHWAEAGDGPLVVLLHGFPETWRTWRHQIPVLAAAGFRVVAPDLRGYGGSERPRATAAYRVPLLAADVAALVRHVAAARGASEARAVVAGHDWGGVVAMALARRHPELVRRLVLLNAPHPGALRRELRHDPRQWLASWYILFFQLPVLPELALRARDFALLRAVFRREPTRPDAYDTEDIERYVEAFRQPGALRAAVAYYRALRLGGSSGAGPAGARRGVIQAPTLVVWGERDAHLVPALSRGLERWFPTLRVERLPDASHWVQRDARERVGELLVEWARTPTSA